MNFRLIWIDVLIISMIYVSANQDTKQMEKVLFKGKDSIEHYVFILAQLSCILVKYFIQNCQTGATMAFLAQVNIIVNYVEFYKFYDDRISQIPLYAYFIQILFYLFSDPNSAVIKGFDFPQDDKLGNIKDIKKAGSLHQFLTKTHAEKGKVFHFFIGQQKFVSVNDQEMIYFSLQELCNKPNELLQSYLKPILGKKSIIFKNDKIAKKTKKQYMNANEIEKHIHILFFKSISEVLKKNSQLLSKYASDKKDINLQQFVTKLVLQIMVVYIFGKKYSDIDISDEILQAYQELWSYLRKRSEEFVPNEQNQETQQQEKIESISEKLRDWVQEMYDSCLQESKSNCFIDQISKEKDEEQVISDLLTIFIDGTEKTTLMIVWSVYYLMTNQEYQRKLQRELDQKFLDEQDGFSFPTLYKIFEKTPIPQNILYESIRLSTLIPYITRVENKDVMLDSGQIVKKGWNIIVPLGFIHVNPESWGVDTDIFKPDRFDQKINQNCQFCPYGFYNFRNLQSGKSSNSIRGCPGQDLASTIGITFITCFFYNFTFSPVKSNEKIQKDFRVVTKPKQDIFCSVKGRNLI